MTDWPAEINRGSLYFAGGNGNGHGAGAGRGHPRVLHAVREGVNREGLREIVLGVETKVRRGEQRACPATGGDGARVGEGGRLARHPSKGRGPVVAGSQRDD